jgi:hypothetical protein
MMRSYTASDISDDDLISITALRRCVGATEEDTENDSDLLALAKQIVDRVEAESGVLLRSQTCIVTAQYPSSSTIRNGVRIDYLSLPFFCQSVEINAASYWDGFDQIDFDDGAVEVISGPRLRWTRPDVLVEHEDCYSFTVAVTPFDIARYESVICSAVAWSFLRSNHPEFTDKLNQILSFFQRGL